MTERMKGGPGDVEIRMAAEADVPALAEIERACFDSPWTEAQIRADVAENDRAYVAVAVLEDKAAGYADVMVAGGEGQLYNIAVAPLYRRMHIGRKLMEHIIGYCRENCCDCITLEVRSGNEEANGLYRGMGFNDVAVRQAYYEDGEDAVLMELVLA